MEHPVHMMIGRLILGDKTAARQVILDSACGGSSAIALHRLSDNYAPATDATHYANVDGAVVEGTVKAIVEIEESGFAPVKICGKVLASALCTHYVCGGERIPLDDSVLFIQILDTSQFDEEKTSKIEQWQGLQKAIQGILPIKGGRVTRYEVFFVEGPDYDTNRPEAERLLATVRKALK